MPPARHRRANSPATASGTSGRRMVPRERTRRAVLPSAGRTGARAPRPRGGQPHSQSRQRRAARRPRPPLSTPYGPNARPAQPFQRTLRVSLLPAKTAGVHHPDMTEREIEADGVVRIQAAQRSGDVCGHLPSGTDITRQAQAAAQPDDVRVERDDEFGGGHVRPRSEIDLVSADHPAEKKVQALARAPGRRTGKEITHAGTPRHASVRAPDVEGERPGGEAVERRADILVLVAVTLEKKALD